MNLQALEAFTVQQMLSFGQMQQATSPWKCTACFDAGHYSLCNEDCGECGRCDVLCTCDAGREVAA